MIQFRAKKSLHVWMYHDENTSFEKVCKTFWHLNWAFTIVKSNFVSPYDFIFLLFDSIIPDWPNWALPPATQVFVAVNFLADWATIGTAADSDSDRAPYHNYTLEAAARLPCALQMQKWRHRLHSCCHRRREQTLFWKKLKRPFLLDLIIEIWLV